LVSKNALIKKGFHEEEEPYSNYNGIHNIAFYVLAMRQSIGDYDTSTIMDNSDYPVLAWFIWGIIMVVGNIVFMNFIIAVVSESYSTNMQKMN
jgi:hypothetical protein